jgi:hypothetical protein
MKGRVRDRRIGENKKVKKRRGDVGYGCLKKGE